MRIAYFLLNANHISLCCSISAVLSCSPLAFIPYSLPVWILFSPIFLSLSSLSPSSSLSLSPSLSRSLSHSLSGSLSRPLSRALSPSSSLSPSRCLGLSLFCSTCFSRSLLRPIYPSLPSQYVLYIYIYACLQFPKSLVVLA